MATRDEAGQGQRERDPQRTALLEREREEHGDVSPSGETVETLRRRQEEAGDPEQSTESSQTTDTAVLPDAPYSEEDVQLLATALRRSNPIFLGNDIRGEESGLRVAKALLDVLHEVGYELPELTAEGRENLQLQSEWVVPTTEARTRHRPQTGPTPSGTSSKSGALVDDPEPTFGAGRGASATSSTDPSHVKKPDEDDDDDKGNEGTSSSGRSGTSTSGKK